MSKTLTFELPDEIYSALVAMALQQGRAPEAVALEYLARHWPKQPPDFNDSAVRAARERLLRHFGAVESGDPRSGDNERIDVDLEREYGDNHEDAR